MRNNSMADDDGAAATNSSSTFRLISSRMRLIVFLGVVMVALFPHHTHSFLFSKPPRRLKVVGGVAVIAFPKKKQLKRILSVQQKKKKRRKDIILLQKKKKKQFAAATVVVAAAAAAAGPLVAATAITTAMVGVGTTVAAVAVLNSPRTSEIYTPVESSLQGQSILITGGTTGLGLETAKRLAIGRPRNLIITSRTTEKGRLAVAAIQEYVAENNDIDNDDDNDDDDDNRPSMNVSYRVLDLDDVEGIQDSVAEWFKDDVFPDQLDCLINNAGVLNIPTAELTIDGVERQISSNHLGHFVFTKMLASRLSPTAKIINVSSSAHQIATSRFIGGNGMDFEYCWTGAPKYNPWKSYGQSKLANILFTQELQRRSTEAGYEWDVACLHPGAVQTDIWRQSSVFGGLANYERLQELLQQNVLQDSNKVIQDGLDALVTKTGDLGLFKTVEQGASTSVWLASGGYQNTPNKKNNKMEGVPTSRTDAQYYVDCQPQSLDELATDTNAAQRLWEESEDRAGIRFEFEIAMFNNNKDNSENDNDNNDYVVENSVATVNDNDDDDDVVEDENKNAVIKGIVEQITEEVVQEITFEQEEAKAKAKADDMEEKKDDENETDDGGGESEPSPRNEGTRDKENVAQEKEEVDAKKNDKGGKNDDDEDELFTMNSNEGKGEEEIIGGQEEEEGNAAAAAAAAADDDEINNELMDTLNKKYRKRKRK